MNVQNENPFDWLLNLTLLHNMALCYQKVGALDECALYIEACILNMKLCLQDEKDEMKKVKYECKAHM